MIAEAAREGTVSRVAGTRCRGCGREPIEPVLDLGSLPSASGFLSADELDAEEPRWPLRAWICPACWLLQLDDEGPDEGEGGAPGLALTSETMRGHARDLVAEVLARTGSPSPRIAETASHGNHLRPFFEVAGVAAETVSWPDPRGGVVLPGVLGSGERVDALVDFFLLSHLREPGGFLDAVRRALAPTGFAVVVFEHVLPLVRDGRFDSLRHGHFSYLSLAALDGMARRAGLDVFDAYEIPAYGGSLVAWLQDAGDRRRRATERVARLRSREVAAGLCRLDTYRAWEARARRSRGGLVDFLAAARRAGRSVAAYGAPTRGNTLLNACGVTRDLVPFTVDRSPARQGTFLPGSHIPVLPPRHLIEARPDYVLILTWDLADEVQAALPEVRAWGGRFVTPIPEATVLP